MSQSLATLSHHHQGLYKRPQNSSQPYLFQHEYERFLLSTENVLAATVKGNHHELLDDFADHEALEHRDTLSDSQGDEVLEQQFNADRPRTVEDIEKWLKNINEPVSSTHFGKNVNSRVSMEKYLSEHLPGMLFDKDFVTTENNNLMNKNLTINYDAIFNDVQNEKLISAHDKDDVFILPDLQLDNLDQLAYCTDDMILTSDILTSPCDQPPCTNINVNTKDFIIRLQETINLISDSNNIFTQELGDNNLDDSVMTLENYVEEDFCNNSLTAITEDSYENNVSCSKSNIDDPSDCLDLESNEDSYIIESNSLALQPSDPTRPTRLHIKLKKVHNSEKKSIEQKNETLDRVFTRSRKKDLSVDNSLAGKEAKNSIATIVRNENSKSLKRRSRKKPSTNDIQKSKRDPLSSYNHQEQTILKALKRVGITDDKLQHFKTEDNIKLWKCHQDNCHRIFEKLCGLRIHLLTHFGIKPFKCDYDGCSWSFYSNDKLLRHKEIRHLKSKDHLCSKPDCRRKFSTLQNLTVHEKLHTRPGIPCQVQECSAKFQSKQCLEAHIKTHREYVPPYVCSYESCGKRFYTNSALMSHKRCHSYSELDVTCSWPGCGKTFDQPSRLKIHMRSHTGQKPYVCTFKGCKWSFSTASKLSRHQKKHNNDRKFICDIGNCKKSYLRPEHLKNHKLTHAEDRFFNCSYCDAEFSFENGLYAHVKKHCIKDFASKGHNKVKKIKTVEKKNASKKKEAYCSRGLPVRISASRLNNTALTDCDTGNDVDPPYLSISVMGVNDNTKDMHFCPVETCPKWYSMKNSLRMHFQRKHKRPLSEIQNRGKTHVTSSAPLPRTINDSPRDLTEGSPSSMETQEVEQLLGGNQGSARTAFTRQYILSLKPDRRVVESSATVDNVVLDVKNLGDSLLLPDEPPSMCCQEDIDVLEYQTVLLDAVPTDNDISMCGLE